MADLENLKSKALTGSLWAIIEKFSLQIVQFIVGVVLARLLEPRDYGLIAITTIFTSISGAITDGGFEKTLIRKKDLTEVDINSVFYINTVLGILMTVILFFSAPFIAAFFNEPSLSPVLRVVSLGLLISAFGQTQKALLMKELHFKKISVAQICSSLAGGIAGVIMAYAGYGVWSLVYSALIAQLVAVLFFWIGSDWYPGLKFSFKTIKEMLPYGSRILATSLLFFLMLQLNNFIIGKFYTKTELGFFNRGSRLPELVISIIQSVVLKMAFPLFAKVQDNGPQFIQVMKKTTKVVAFISLPLLTLLLMNADNITLVLFTEKWRGSIIFLEYFCLIRLFEPFIAIHRELILAKGNAKLLLRIFLIGSAAEVILVFIAARYSITYVILATLISKLGQYIAYLIITSSTVKIPWQSQLNWIKPYFIISLITALYLKSLGYFLSRTGFSMLTILMIRLFTGSIIYMFLAWLAKLDELGFIKVLFSSFEKKFFFQLRKQKFLYKKS
jgi:O-antigen/teichoic acid export membrane protein